MCVQCGDTEEEMIGLAWEIVKHLPEKMLDLVTEDERQSKFVKFERVAQKK